MHYSLGIPEDAINHLNIAYNCAKRIGLDLRFLGLVERFRDGEVWYFAGVELPKRG